MPIVKLQSMQELICLGSESEEGWVNTWNFKSETCCNITGNDFRNGKTFNEYKYYPVTIESEKEEYVLKSF